MKECPYCYAPVNGNDTACPQCGREIEKWKTGFYTRQPLPGKGRSAVQVGAGLVLALLLFGFARACHWF